MKVLYLSEWYPHRYDAMPGLFVRKHAAAAVRQGADVCVLYLHPDKQIKGEEITEQTTAGIREICVYYGGSYLKALQKGYKTLRERWGMPDIVQLNVLTKNGLLPLYLNLRYGIPYIIVEHWSGYLPENNSFRGGLHGRLMKLIAQRAKCILPVSEALENAMKNCGIRCAHWSRIHNVVDDFFFEERTTEGKQEKFQFLHVSCFDERSKNTQGILRAVDLLQKERTDFEIHFVGTGPDFESTVRLSDQLGLTGKIAFFEGEKTPQEVHEAMLNSQCFVLFSRYETAGVVLAECLASGLPVIGSRAGAIPEVVSKQNGVLVESENTDQLATAMSRMIDHAGEFSKADIRAMAGRYSEEAVGKMLLDTYTKYAH
ncbi:MAG: glycosyltransferase [Bacteroidales bacterium]|nr:glycosyltransferase [Candidatus Colicola faecequi]